MNRRGVGLALLAVVVVGASVAAWEGWRREMARRLDQGLQSARTDLERGRLALARKTLEGLAAAHGDDGRIALALGDVHAAAGAVDDAERAWGGIDPGSPRGAEAALRRADLAMHQLGRLSAAGEILEGALPGASGPDAFSIRLLLNRLYRWEGRIDRVIAMTEANWEEAPDPRAELRDLATIDLGTWPVEGVRQVLTKSEAKAPEDDGVWLGWANLAIRLGELDEARRRVDRCIARGPGDPAAWEAALDLAVASDDLGSARAAVARLAELGVPIAAERSRRVMAWAARRRQDPDREADALEAVHRLVPGDPAPLERLIEIRFAQGRSEEAARLRARKVRLDQVHHEFVLLLAAIHRQPRAAEFARVTESLGRRFEARGWWTLALREQDPDAAEALRRLEGPDPAREPADLAVLAAALAGPAGPSRGAGRGEGDDAERGHPLFRDDAEASGLRFTFQSGKTFLHHLPETMSGGLALLDYDGDGWLDVYCVQGGTYPPPASISNQDRLFRNRGDGTFEDVTEHAGLDKFPGGYGHGVTVGDYDNDGRPDLFVTRWRSYALYRNRGDGTFEDVTERMGLGGDRDWPTSAAFADLDNDGDLDLYVCHYALWDPDNPAPCPRVVEGRDEYMYCSPLKLPSLPDRLYRNDGGRFADIGRESGIADPHGRGLGVLANDFDGDGWVDLYVANDMTANYLFRNLGGEGKGLRFEEIGELAGVAGNIDGGYQAGMGIACGDPDGDGLPDLVITNFYGEGSTFYRNLGRGLFSDQTAAVGLKSATRYVLGFGVAFADADGDGRLDLIQANGHVNDAAPIFPYRMTPQLLLGRDGGRFADASGRAGEVWKAPRLGRGLAVGDLDNDGRPDALVLNQDEPATFLHNQSPEASGRTLTILLEGGGSSNRDAIGAKVLVRAGGKEQARWRFGGGSYQSAGDPRLCIGLGDAKGAEEVEVRWPSGHSDTYRNLEAGRGYRLREGRDDEPAPSLEGFSPSRNSP